jgi:hypothetical protein
MANGLHAHHHRHEEILRGFMEQALRTAGALTVALLLIAALYAGIDFLMKQRLP